MTAELNPTISAKIEELQRAEEQVRRLQDDLIDAATREPATVVPAIREAIIEGLGAGDGVEAAIALVPLAEVLGELEGPEICDLLIELLGCEEPEVRFTAGRALQDLAYDRFKEVAEATERAITRLAPTSPALRELPFVIAEVGEPGAYRVLRGYLAHSEGEVVASAIEALASLGDPASLPDLRKLMRDTRTVQVDDDEGEAQASVGMLASEAIAIIEGGADEGAAPPPPRRGRR